MNTNYENTNETTLDCIDAVLNRLRDYFIKGKVLSYYDIMMCETLIQEYRDILDNDKNY